MEWTSGNGGHISTMAFPLLLVNKCSNRVLNHSISAIKLDFKLNSNLLLGQHNQNDIIHLQTLILGHTVSHDQL